MYNLSEDIMNEQTGRTFKTRCREHIQALKANKQSSKYAQHILGTGHSYRTVQGPMDILHLKKKGQLLDTLKRFHMLDLNKWKLQMNDTFTDIYITQYVASF
jgi:hypothetical protein